MSELGHDAIAHRIPLPDGDDPVVLTWAALSDVGRRRSANEDSYAAVPPLFAVADGMGGHSAGDLASAAVVERLAESVVGDFGTVAQLEAGLAAATDDIVEIAGDSEIGVGTTVTGAMLALVDGRPCFVVFNIGDSRVYAFDRNELLQVTTDHSVVQELVDAGTLTKEEAEHHPDSNIITRAVGFGAVPVPDYRVVPLRRGMRLLICSDGLTREVGDERLRLHLAAGLASTETAGALVDAALAAGGRDNITTIVIDVVEAPDPLDVEDTEPRVTSPSRSD